MGRISTYSVREFNQSVGFGLINGYTRVTAIGHNPDVDTASVPEDIWEGGGLIPWITTATKLDIVSTSVLDTATAGTGARTVSISGLDANYVPISETLALNGTTPVKSVNTYFRVNNFMINSAGSTEVNQGDISLQITGGGALQSLIRSLVGFARSSAYTVPAGFTLSMNSLVLSINRAGTIQNATMNTYFRSSSGFYRTPLILDATSSGPYLHEGLPGIIVAEKTDITIRCTYTSVNNMDLTAGWLGVLKNNNIQ